MKFQYQKFEFHGDPVRHHFKLVKGIRVCRVRPVVERALVGMTLLA